MGNFKLIQDHFTHLNCPYCEHPFTHNCVNLLREEKDYWVVKVVCSSCSKSVGIAIVGVDYEGVSDKRDESKFESFSRKDHERLLNKKPINYDDVIEAHRFIQDLGSDWMKYLPR